jgi:hypothetical protein
MVWMKVAGMSHEFTPQHPATSFTRKLGIRSGESTKVNLRARRSYFGGCSSPFNQPITLSVFSGSGRSHPEQLNLRGLSPP